MKQEKQALSSPVAAVNIALYEPRHASLITHRDRISAWEASSIRATGRSDVDNIYGARAKER